MLTESCKKVAENFCCIICDYNTSRKSSYSKHLLTVQIFFVKIVIKNIFHVLDYGNIIKYVMNNQFQ